MAPVCPQYGVSLGDAIHSCALPDVSSSARHAMHASLSAALSAPLASNLVAALSYAFGFFSGIVFLVLDPYKRDCYVRFHAWQSVFFSLAWILFWIPCLSSVASGMAVAAGGLQASGTFSLLLLVVTAVVRLISLAGFLYWIFLIYKAYSNQRYQVPLIGKLAAAQAERAIV